MNTKLELSQQHSKQLGGPLSPCISDPGKDTLNVTLTSRGHQIIRTTDVLSNVLIMKSCADASATYLISWSRTIVRENSQQMMAIMNMT